MGSDSSKPSNSPTSGPSASASKKADDGVPGPSGGTPVYLNVYNLQRTGKAGRSSINGAMGFGVYHSGIEILGVEWAFGGNPGAPPEQPGVFCLYPRTCLPPDQFHEQVLLMRVGGLTQQKVQQVLSAMIQEWMAASYHLLAKNCNHFAEAFAKKLSAEFGIEGVKLPKYVNRAARFGDVLVPDAIYRSMMRSVPQPPQGATTSNFTAGATNSGGGGGARQGQQQAYHQPDTKAEEATKIPVPKTREELVKMSVREMKTMMWVNGISWDGCIEKDDLIDAVLRYNEASK